MNKTTFALVLFFSQYSILNTQYCFSQIKIDTEKLQKQIQAAVTAIEKQKSQKRNFTLEEIWKENKFKGETVNGINSMKDGLHYTSLESDTADSGRNFIVKYSYKTGKAADTIIKSEALIPEGKNSPVEIESYQFSADETKLLISTESESIYRHSTKEFYYVCDIKTKKLVEISEEKIRLAEFSPTGNVVAYVKDNNVFVQDLTPLSNGKGLGVRLQITNDGKFNAIINGATDWVYEEEFSFDKAFFWSPDAKKIAYYKFDEGNVKEFSMDMYGTLYPSQYRFKYPKAGEENAKVSIHIFNFETKQNQKINIGNNYEYIPRIKWTKDANTLSIQKMNRHQNKLELLLADATTGNAKIILTDTSDTYIDVSDDLTFLDDKQYFIWTSDKSGYNHIYLYDISGKQIRQITPPMAGDVIEFLGMDEKSQTLFYISAEEGATERNLYSVKMDGTGKKKLSQKNGFNNAVFSEGFKYLINEHSDANTPSFISLHDATGKEIRVLKDNLQLKDTLALYNISQKEFFKFKTSENIELNGWLIKPANFDSTKKYPVFMYVYGGPGAQTVQNNWSGGNHLWFEYLAQKGYVIVSVDNRGTGARGAAFKKCTYKELGKLETLDQIETAKYLSTLSFVDKNRIGIFGWSYGGYMSSLCITKGADIFKMAIAVAPVTNWRFYDSIYTERYMLTPQENPNGYDDNSPINHVAQLKGKYLLIHGTADDNVHLQNSVEMVNALVKANKQFDVFFYPDRNHGIYGGNSRIHLYTKMTDFILQNL